VEAGAAGGSAKYVMTVSRLTIDNLGIKMYDRIPRVLAELISNSYDADATKVVVTLPLGQFLAHAGPAGNDRGKAITVEDNGVGMTAEEVNDYYLRVGTNRRNRRDEGVSTRGRRVMGRKGIGKLAPFGVCNEIEVVTAGGEQTSQGYLVSHLVLRFEDIVSDTDEQYYPDPGPMDGTYSPKTGTTVVLRHFQRKRVPSGEELASQLAPRFGIRRDDWLVEIIDADDPSNAVQVGAAHVAVMEGTTIDVATRQLISDGEHWPITGWVAYAQDSYKDPEMAGVRIYARDKLVAKTLDFGLKSGFTGEFKMRSYVVGELRVEWLDDNEDLVKPDRQDIIWNSPEGEALQAWGQTLLRDLAASAESSVRNRVWRDFVEVSNFEQVLRERAPADKMMQNFVRETARHLVRGRDRDDVRKPEQVDRVVRLAFAIAPHQELLESLNEVAEAHEPVMSFVLELFDKARIAEMYSLGQVASERVDVLNQLAGLTSQSDTEELELQKLIERAPWVLNPEWTPLTMNQTLTATRRAFEEWYQRMYGEVISTTAIDRPGKRPDFVLLGAGATIQIVELKRPARVLDDGEYDRALGYLQAVRRFIRDHDTVRDHFPKCALILVCNDMNLKRPANQSSFDSDPAITRRSWEEVLQLSRKAHEDFLRRVDQMKAGNGSSDDNPAA
jgi:hypothetical protein